MGLLILDHRGTTEPDGAKGKLREIRTICCAHCSKAVKIIEGTGEPPAWIMEHHRKCTRCDMPICMACAVQMKLSGGLCNPFEARVEHALKTGGWDEKYQFEYKIRPN